MKEDHNLEALIKAVVAKREGTTTTMMMMTSKSLEPTTQTTMLDLK